MKQKYYNIILVGYRGMGKSTICRKLHQIMPYYKLISTDDLVEQKMDCPIIEYFEKNTWKEFRLLEKHVFEEIANEKKIILDCGGGVVETEENKNFLKKKNNLVFWIDTDINMVIDRITNSKVTRPRLMPDKTIAEETHHILEKRNALYQECSTMRIDATNLHPVDTAKKIVEYYENFQRM